MKTFILLVLGFGCSMLLSWVLVFKTEPRWSWAGLVCVFIIVQIARWDGAFGERRKRGEVE